VKEAAARPPIAQPFSTEGSTGNFELSGQEPPCTVRVAASMYTGSMVGAGAMALCHYGILHSQRQKSTRGATSGSEPSSACSGIWRANKKRFDTAIQYLESPDARSQVLQTATGRRIIKVGPGPFRLQSRQPSEIPRRPELQRSLPSTGVSIANGRGLENKDSLCSQ